VSSSEGVYVIGGGGHAKVVISTLRAMGASLKGVLDDSPRLRGLEIAGVPVLGPIELLADQTTPSAIIAVGSNAFRRQTALKFPHVRWVCALHPTAVIDPSVMIGAGSVVFAGAVLQVDVRLGDHVIVNTGATVDHDGTLHDYTHLAPGVHLAGNVTVAEGAFVGVATAVIPGRRIGPWATVGAGAVVVRDLPANVTAVGTPARTIKKREDGWHTS